MARALVLLLVLLAAIACAPARAGRLIVTANGTIITGTPLDELRALAAKLPTEALAKAVGAVDFQAWLAQAVNTTEQLVKHKVDKQAELFGKALNLTGKLLPTELLLAKVNSSYVVTLPAPGLLDAAADVANAVPTVNVSVPFVAAFNKSLTIKGLPTIGLLKKSLNVSVPVIPLLKSKIILSKNASATTVVTAGGS